MNQKIKILNIILSYSAVYTRSFNKNPRVNNPPPLDKRKFQILRKGLITKDQRLLGAEEHSESESGVVFKNFRVGVDGTWT